MTGWTEIFASEERKEALSKANIKFVVDQDLKFGFKSHDDLINAKKVLKVSLELEGP